MLLFSARNCRSLTANMVAWIGRIPRGGTRRCGQEVPFISRPGRYLEIVSAGRSAVEVWIWKGQEACGSVSWAGCQQPRIARLTSFQRRRRASSFPSRIRQVHAGGDSRTAMGNWFQRSAEGGVKHEVEVSQFRKPLFTGNGLMIPQTRSSKGAHGSE